MKHYYGKVLTENEVNDKAVKTGLTREQALKMARKMLEGKTNPYYANETEKKE